jgi:hypothetical protein
MGFKKARVSGLVTYLNENNQRVSVPIGSCEISTNNGMGPYLLRWQHENTIKQIELSLNEFSQYQNTKDFVILD